MKRNATYSNQGFTLLEVMVIVVLLAILMAVASLSISNPELRELKREARRLQTLFEFALDEAQLEGITLGAAFDGPTLTWMSYLTKEGTWLPWGQERFASYTLSNANWTYEILGAAEEDLFEEFKLTDTEDDDAPAPIFPDIVFLPYGEVTPFEVVIEAEQSTAWLRVEDGLNPQWTLRYETD